MSNPFIGQIELFAGNFAPRSWAFCSGQLLAISSNTALFSILGTTYGGDGRTTFGLPDLRGRVPRGSEGNSAGPGLPTVILGQKAGAPTHTLNPSELPSHTHVTAVTIHGSSKEGDSSIPTGRFPAKSGDEDFYADAKNIELGAGSVTTSLANAGGNLSHSLLNPYLGMNYIIALFGVFPSRN